MEAGGAGNNQFCLSFRFDGMQGNDTYQSMRPIAGYEFDQLWNLVNKISQSAGGFNVTDTFQIKLHAVEAMADQK